MTLNDKLQLRLSIYFALSPKQKKQLHSISHQSTFDNDLTIAEFNAITSSKKLREDFRRLKYGEGLRLVVDNGNVKGQRSRADLRLVA